MLDDLFDALVAASDLPFHHPRRVAQILLNLAVLAIVAFTVYLMLESMAQANPVQVYPGWIRVGAPVGAGVTSLVPLNWLLLGAFRE